MTRLIPVDELLTKIEREKSEWADSAWNEAVDACVEIVRKNLPNVLAHQNQLIGEMAFALRKCDAILKCDVAPRVDETGKSRFLSVLDLISNCLDQAEKYRGAPGSGMGMAKGAGI